MRVTFVVQRYGAGIAGGAETHCRAFAIRLARAGHDITVVTSRARSYTTWANEMPEGSSLEDGVTVRRLSTRFERDVSFFAPMSTRVLIGRCPPPRHVQRRWLEVQGPVLEGFDTELDSIARTADVVVFFTYLYWPTVVGLDTLVGRVPLVLHPTAHDELSFHLPFVRTTLHLPDAFAFSTPEERALVATKVPIPEPSAVVGVGVDIDDSDLNAPAARSIVGLSDRPYVLAVGRVDASKGAHELAAFFATYKLRRPGPLALVIAGDPVQPVPAHPDVIQMGVVDERTKHGLYRGAEVVVVPSFFESFSMVLTEAWVHGRPALVQGRCDVLAGQVGRSKGGLAYRGYAEFETALDLLLARTDIADALGEKGRAYTNANYTWPAVLGRYVDLLERVAGH